MTARSLEPNCMDEEKDAVKILCVGRLVELKGFHLCVEPCRRLLDKGYNIKWYVAGEGGYRPVIEELIKQHHLEDNFILLGNCPNPYSYIRSADICVQPSRYEGFSLSVIEGKFFKKPMVVSDIPSNMEMIKDGYNGLIVERNPKEIYKAVERLVSDEKLRKELGENPSLVEISNEKIMKDFMDLFSK
jgi:glycosyltransferase involved in cell wall biosynthesis